ncbi:hypothetical protein NDU88_003752 [Pleurodeles waltl]|uniref:Uncharacterized protein n=1 Tax=Pleurodeles waltl TaxID=8319 RepID=A0AAV7W718_PLEWA|nr:hypothetical protein NDU88_003752 [Pleurodeles waltl]
MVQQFANVYHLPAFKEECLAAVTLKIEQADHLLKEVDSQYLIREEALVGAHPLCRASDRMAAAMLACSPIRKNEFSGAKVSGRDRFQVLRAYQ